MEGGATDAGQPRGTTPEVISLIARSSETFLCQISKGKGYSSLCQILFSVLDSRASK